MKVKNLLQILQECDQDAEIWMSIDEEYNECKPVTRIKVTHFNTNLAYLLVPNDFIHEEPTFIFNLEEEW